MERFRSLRIGDVGISVITLAELQHGVARSSDPESNQLALIMFTAPLLVPGFDDAAAEAYGVLRARLQARGQVIGIMDMLIAAHALSLDLTLVTRNTREFERIDGLRVEDWSDDVGGLTVTAQ